MGDGYILWGITPLGSENTRYILLLLHSYNNTHHRSIGMAPSEVNADNEDVVDFIP